MSDPPGKGTSGSRERAAQTQTIVPPEDTPLVCGAQVGCEHNSTRIECLANGPHAAREICTDCGRVLRWIEKPGTAAQRQFNSFRIQRLLISGELTAWERCFIDSIARLRKLSPRQKATLDKIYQERAL